MLNNGVELHVNGSATVTSQHNGSLAYHVVNGACECADHPKAPASWCKHKLAKTLVVRAMAIAKTMRAADDGTTAAPEPPEPTIPPQFLTEIQGKTFVLSSGLLAMATSQGLLSLSINLVAVEELD